MNPNRKSNIAALALSAAVFFTTSLLAKPPAQNYPEYPQNQGVPAVQAAADNAAPYVAPVAAAATAAATRNNTSSAASTTTPPPAVAVAPAGTYANNADVCCAGCSVGTRFDSNLVTIEKFLISSPGIVGSDVQYKVRATANANVTNVSLTENLPPGCTFVSADPDVAKGAGNSLNWTYPTMSKGEAKDVLITVRPTQEGTFIANTKVCVDPAVCVAFKAGSPKLAIEKTGPGTAELDSQVSFDVKVTNVGTATATDVVMTDNLPDGLRGPNGQQPSWPLGNMAPGESKTIQVPCTAAQQGHFVNRACAVGSNVQQVCAEAPIDVLLAKLQVQKTGPDRLFINHEAKYNITVTNVGTTVLNNVTVTDNLPAGTKLLSVDGQPASQNQSTVTWAPIPSLQPGESKSSALSLTSPQPGTTVNNVTAASGRISDSASAQTIWEAPPGVLTEIVDDVDPVRVGDTVVYTIRITNQGEWRDINTQIKVMYGDEITPIECDAPGAVINGKIVTVPDDTLKPKGVKTFHIKTKAEQTGLHTTRLQFNSSFLPRPVDKDETTLVY